MEFARKQLEKYGWKEGDGLGTQGQGISAAVKPHYKHGKEGMGFELGKELTDTWWTRAYDDSLKRINVDADSEKVIVTTPNNPNSKDTPLVQMRKRMMKANFTQFSKGGTLDQGKLLKGSSDEEDNNNDDDEPPPPKIANLNDEDLLKACGGRTAHKAARFGHKLSGKLARLAAQDAYLLEHPDVLLPKEKPSKKKTKKSKKDKSKKEDSEPLL